MPLKIKSHSQALPYRSIMIKGEPTAGKSWLAANMPNPIFVDFDKNSGRLDKLPANIKDSIKYIDATVDGNDNPLKGRLVWGNLMQIIAEIKKEIKDHTIIIDSATAVEPFILMHIASSEKPDSYGDLSFSNGRYQVLATYWEQFFDLLTKDSSMHNHVVLIVHEKYSEVPSDINNAKSDKRPVWKPLFTGAKTSEQVEKYFTDVWRCYVDNSIKGKRRYMATTVPTMAYKALCSINLPETFEVSSQLQSIKDQLSFNKQIQIQTQE